MYRNPTRLSLDAIRVPGSVFYFVYPLAFMVGIFLYRKPTRLSLDAIRVPGSVFLFCLFTRVYGEDLFVP